MKKLSIEEKVKAYDNIIEKANKMHHENCEACQMCIEELIPELKESDDERIRKEIKDFFSRIMLGQENFLREDYDWNAWIAWLEKQGDNRLMKALQEANKKIGELVEENYYLKEQCEQKPNDKVEPKFKVGDIVKHKDNPHLTYILKRFTDDGNYEFHAIGKDGHEGCTCFAVVKYQDDWELVEQNPAEWKPSDEQIKALENILKFFRMHNAFGETISELKELEAQLKKLRKE